MVPKLPPDSLAFSFVHAARVVAAVLAGRSLAEGLLDAVPDGARPAVQDLVYTTLRRYGFGDALLDRLLDRPLDVPEIRALLLVALQRLEVRPDSAFTVVDQAVEAAGTFARGRLRALVNGVLRNALRRWDELVAEVEADGVVRHGLPGWWLAELQRAYPDHWQAIAEAGNQAPPMALRANRRRTTSAEYLDRLGDAGIEAELRGESGLLLGRPLPVDRLPDFAAGVVSVQDLGAQRAAELLDPAPGSRVLDACAAPGGKTAHLLERAELDLLALDLKPARCRRVTSNLDRLGLRAKVEAGNCAQPASWWDGQPFAAILADVPCTASGVVRRNPDAKWLRREEDIASFAATQSVILEALWPLLAPGGRLLYATCSVFPRENGLQMQAFQARHPDASCRHEEQLLPDREHDAFYYCLLEKSR